MIDIFYYIFDIYTINALSFDLLRASLKNFAQLIAGCALDERQRRWFYGFLACCSCALTRCFSDYRQGGPARGRGIWGAPRHKKIAQGAHSSSRRRPQARRSKPARHEGEFEYSSGKLYRRGSYARDSLDNAQLEKNCRTP